MCEAIRAQISQNLGRYISCMQLVVSGRARIWKLSTCQIKGNIWLEHRETVNTKNHSIYATCTAGRRRSNTQRRILRNGGRRSRCTDRDLCHRDRGRMWVDSGTAPLFLSEPAGLWRQKQDYCNVPSVSESRKMQKIVNYNYSSPQKKVCLKGQFPCKSVPHRVYGSIFYRFRGNIRHSDVAWHRSEEE